MTITFEIKPGTEMTRFVEEIQKILVINDAAGRTMFEFLPEVILKNYPIWESFIGKDNDIDSRKYERFMEYAKTAKPEDLKKILYTKDWLE